MSDRIDLRSDTVTVPSDEMRHAMASAEVGDDVYGEDPTIQRLEEMVSAMFGKERGLFVPTGVMANQLCLKSLTEPGDEVIAGKRSHIFNYETGAPALLSGIQLHTISDDRGQLDLGEAEGAVRESAYYLPRTAVIAQEQSHNREGGTIIPDTHFESVAAFAEERGIARHLDGARIWNAMVATGHTARYYGDQMETVSVCLSKGLGAPIGSVMAASARLVEKAHRFRKIWGGGWRQGGILAAAGIHALEHNVERLKTDHLNARSFHSMIATSEHLIVDEPPETNIVLIRSRSIPIGKVIEGSQSVGLFLSGAFKGAARAVFHMGISHDAAVDAAGRLLQVVDDLAERSELSTS